MWAEQEEEAQRAVANGGVLIIRLSLVCLSSSSLVVHCLRAIIHARDSKRVVSASRRRHQHVLACCPSPACSFPSLLEAHTVAIRVSPSFSLEFLQLIRPS